MASAMPAIMKAFRPVEKYIRTVTMLRTHGEASAEALSYDTTSTFISTADIDVVHLPGPLSGISSWRSLTRITTVFAKAQLQVPSGLRYQHKSSALGHHYVVFNSISRYVRCPSCHATCNCRSCNNVGFPRRWIGPNHGREKYPD